MAVSQQWKLTRFTYFVDFLTTPALMAVSLLLGEWSIALFVLGALLWSLLEYGLHRFSFHRHFRKDHWAHHVNPQDYIGISGLWISMLLGLLATVAYHFHGAALFSGFACGYWWYLCIHYCIHQPGNMLCWLFPTLVRNHEKHHQRGVEKNFGVTSPLWDYVLGTYAK